MSQIEIVHCINIDNKRLKEYIKTPDRTTENQPLTIHFVGGFLFFASTVASTLKKSDEFPCEDSRELTAKNQISLLCL